MLSDGKEINFKNLRHSKYVNFNLFKAFPKGLDTSLWSEIMF